MTADLLVVGATPAGIGAAVRAAREGLTVVVTNRTAHVGGMLASGLQVYDTIYEGYRAPLWQEFTERMQEQYRSRYGPDSEQLRKCSYRDPSRHGSRPAFEPHVAEAACAAMLAGERRIILLTGWIPTAVERTGALIAAIRVRRYRGDDERRIAAAAYVDATYEGDLAALAGAPYRVGRESRDEYSEPHAGRIFTRIDPVSYPKQDLLPRMNLHMFSRTSGALWAGSTGEGDDAVMAYCTRLVLTRATENRIPVEPPQGYAPDEYLPLLQDEVANLGARTRLASSWLLTDPEGIRFGAGAMPNGKRNWLGGNLVGGNHRYPDADWPERERIIAEHTDFALGLLYFLQHDERVPQEVRRDVGAWGLPKDEFTDNGGIPPEIYVREARRIVGRDVFTEHDGTLAPGIGRSPVKSDSVGITDWPMDSHDCHAERMPGSMNEGEFMLTEKTRPAQVAFRTLLPVGLDNLLVAWCISATHVGWGTIRLEPTMMPVGESAGWAAVLAAQSGVAPAAVEPDELVRSLVEHRIMVSFFNEFDMASDAPWVPAVQFLGTRGFFSDYDARPADPLGRRTASVWAAAAAEVMAGELDAAATARRIAAVGGAEEGNATRADLLEMVAGELRRRGLPPPGERAGAGGTAISRADAALLLYGLTAR